MREPQKDWPAVPGTNERAPLIDIIVFVVACAVLLGGLIGTAMSLILMLVGGV